MPHFAANLKEAGIRLLFDSFGCRGTIGCEYKPKRDEGIHVTTFGLSLSKPFDRLGANGPWGTST